MSLTEPHDPYFCGEEAFAQYNPDETPLSPSLHDKMEKQPNIYRRLQHIWQDWTEQNHREAATCYWASITEIDALYGQLLDKIEAAGQQENTIVVFTADHGDLLGAHGGLYCKNYTAFEEIYNIPLIMAGPGIDDGKISQARVGLHDVGPTLLELTNSEPLDVPDSHSFAPVLSDSSHDADFQRGYAEHSGGASMLFTQRVVWDGDWKFIFNDFDFDELYNLKEDPYERNNLAEEPQYQERVKKMTRQMWQRCKETNDWRLVNSQYPILRVASYGPDF